MDWRRLLVALAAVPLLAFSPQSTDAPPAIGQLAQRAGAYVRRFEASFANVVAEGTYLQRAPVQFAREGPTAGQIVDVQRELRTAGR